MIIAPCTTVLCKKIYIKLLRQFYAIYMYMVMSDLSFFFIYNYIYFSFLTSYVVMCLLKFTCKVTTEQLLVTDNKILLYDIVIYNTGLQNSS